MPTRTKPTDDAPLAASAPASAAGQAAATGAAPPPDLHRGDPAHPGVPLSPPGIVPESDVRVHSPSSAAPQPSHGHVNEGLGELPWAYGDARLVSMVRDPTTLFIYWDFSRQQVDQAFSGLGIARAVLKLFATRGGGAELLRDTEVHLDARGWYSRDLPPGTELRAELWAVGEKGARMLRAARPVKLPAQTPSDQLETFYLRLPLDHSLRDGIHAGRPLQYGGAAPAGWERRVQPRAAESSQGPLGTNSGARLPWSMTHLMLPDLEGEK